MVQRSPTTSTRRIALRLHVPQSRVWRTLHYDGLYPFHHQPVQRLHPGDDAHRLQFCHWLSHNRELLPYILFTDEATFTCNGITNTRNCHNWAQDNPHATVQKNFPEIWDSRHMHYKDRDKRSMCWHSMGEALNTSVGELQRKIHNLCNQVTVSRTVLHILCSLCEMDYYIL